MADEFDLPLMIHVQETRLQVVTGQVLFGSTMVEYLDRIGFLKPMTALIHAVWLNPREIEILAHTGASVQHNPTCNLKMGSGIAPVRALLDAGVNVSMGTDGPSRPSPASLDPTTFSCRNAAPSVSRTPGLSSSRSSDSRPTGPSGRAASAAGTSTDTTERSVSIRSGIVGSL